MKTHSFAILFFCSAALSAGIFSCNRSGGTIKIGGKAQGTFYTVIYRDKENRNLQQEVDSLLRAFDLSASLWVENSTLNRLNRGDDSLMDNITADLLEKSLAINRYTSGAFDCRVGKLVNAWGFGAKTRTTLDTAAVDSLLRICYAAVAIHRHDDVSAGGAVLWREDKRTEIDFNAIAQGFSVDLLAGFLQSKGIKNYLIDVGGEIIAKGCKEGGQPWIVGIEKPAADSTSIPQVMESVALRDAALVTSGNYRKYYEKDGTRYSHTIDPSTGFPVNHTLLSATVVDTTAWKADALATAFMVMGLDSAKHFIDRHPEIKHAFFIYDEKGQYKTYATPEMQRLIDGF